MSKFLSLPGIGATILYLLIFSPFVEQQLQGQVLTEPSISTDGVVYSLERDGNTLYIGGNFNNAGYYTGSGALLQVNNDGPQAPLPFINNDVYVSITDEQGGWYVGGRFTQVSGIPRRYLAHILADGTVDPDFDPAPDDYIYALALTNDSLYVGGEFTSIAGQTHSRLAVLNAGSGVAFAWSADANGHVRALALEGDYVYVGGDFTQISGRNQQRFAKIDKVSGASIITTSTNGAVRAIELGSNQNGYLGGSFSAGGFYTGNSSLISPSSGLPETKHPFVDGLVLVSIPDGNGGWFVGGDFNNVGGLARANLVHILASGAVDPNFNPAPNNDVFTLELEGNLLYVGGQFTVIGNQSRNRLAAVDINSGATNTWNPDANGIVRALSIQGNDVYVGGSFTEIGGEPHPYFSRIDKTSGLTQLSIAVNSTVYTIEQGSSDVYIGGSFSNGGFYTGGGAMTSTTSAIPNNNFPFLDDDVEVAVPDGTGGWYLGGRFDRVLIGVQAYDHLLHILPNGDIDPNFHPEPNANVYALVRDGNTLYVGGTFTAIAGQTRNRLAAIDLTTGNALAWNPDANNYINDMIIEGNTVYVGGAFTQLSGQSRNYIAGIDKATGTLSTWDPNANGQIQALAYEGGLIYTGGSFSTIGGQTRSRIAAIDASTGTVNTWNPVSNNIVYDILIDGSSAYVGGAFTTIGGQPRNRIAELDLNTGNASTWNPDCNDQVYTLASDGTSIYLGGQFTLVGAQGRNYGAAVNKTTGVLGSWNPNANFYIQEIAINAGDVLLGGSFAYLGYETRGRILSFDESTQIISTWNPTANSDVYDCLIEGSSVYVGGRFTTIGGQPRTNLAEIDLNTGLATAWAPNPDDDVNTIISDGTNLYFGGDFDQVAGQTRNRVAAVDLGSGIPVANWDPNANGSVEILGIDGTEIFIGGYFTYLDYFLRRDLLEMNSQTGEISDWNPASNNDVYALKSEGNLLYVGGRFTNIGGQVRNNLAALDLTSAQATTWNPSPNDDVFAIDTDGTSVFIGGYFTQVDGQDRNYLASIEASSGNVVSTWDPNPQSYVFSLSMVGSQLFVGGQFDYMDYRSRRNLMAINLDNNTIADWNPGSNSTINTIAISPAAIFVGGSFTQVGGQPRNRVAALDKNTGNASLWNPDVNSTVETIVVDGSRIYLGGSFTQIGNQTRNYLAAVDLSGNPTTWNPDMNWRVSEMLISGEQIYVGGGFTTVGGIARNYLAAFNKASGALSDWDPSPNSTVESLFATSATIYAGGNFSQVGGEDRRGIVAISKATALPRKWNPGANSTVYDIHVVSDQVFYGGNFTVGGGQTVSDFAAVNANTGISTRWYPQFNSTVYAINTYDSTLYAGGGFTQIDNVPRTYLGAFTFPSESFKAKLESITPDVAGNTGDATVTIFGAGFKDGTIVKLTKTGESDIIIPDSLIRIIDEIQIIGQINLRDATEGKWSLVVETVDTLMSLTDSFEVVPGQEPEISVELIGFSAIRPNQWQSYIVSYENKGNVDAKGVPLFIAIPDDTEVEFNFDIITPVDTISSVFDTIPIFRPVNSIHGLPFNGRVYSFIIPIIPSNSSGQLSFQIKTQRQGEIEMAVWAYPPMFGSPLKYIVGECIDDLIGAVAGVFPGVGCVQLAMDAAITPIFDYFLDPEFSTDGSSAYVASYQYSLIKNTWGCVAGGITNGWTLGAYALDLFFTLETSVTTGIKCANALTPKIPELREIQIIAAIDPNDKVGPIGGITSDAEIPYLIRFENLSSATALAQKVIIEDTLDTDVYDLSSFELGYISVGERVINLPPARKSLTTEIDLSPLYNVILHIEASLDTTSGLVRWEFSSLDPNTLLPVADPFAGFLPPNITAPEGEGSVFFTIRLKENLPTGTDITNAANIYFDNNPVIPTEPWTNTVDDIKPQSEVNDLDASTGVADFVVNWSGSDQGSGIKSYDLYVSINGNDFIPWLVNTTATSAIFSGENDSTYSFYSISIDSANNVEEAPITPDATTMVTVGIFDGNLANAIKYKIYPNPNVGTFTIEIENPSLKEVEVELMNTRGQVILQRKYPGGFSKDMIQLENVSNGLYLVRLTQGLKTTTQRVLIQK